MKLLIKVLLVLDAALLIALLFYVGEVTDAIGLWWTSILVMLGAAVAVKGSSYLLGVDLPHLHRGE